MVVGRLPLSKLFFFAMSIFRPAQIATIGLADVAILGDDRRRVR